MVSICAIERGFVSWCTTVPPVSKLKAMGNWQIWNWVSGACVYHFKMKLFMVHFYDISFLREVGFIKIRALFEQNVRNFHSHGFIIAKCIFSLNWIITNLTPSLYSANRDHNKITILRDENHCHVLSNKLVKDLGTFCIGIWTDYRYRIINHDPKKSFSF